MIGIGAVGIVALIWTGVADVLLIGVVSIVAIGMTAGMAINRFLGVVRPIPETRRRREQSDGYNYFRLQPATCNLGGEPCGNEHGEKDVENHLRRGRSLG